ncbi:MAG: hypothetical protein HY901_09145, partial [Deltaproteobacteria bacterium]|nr:hypothetical protein [Deltaproteobacteria bacterium]
MSLACTTALFFLAAIPSPVVACPPGTALQGLAPPEGEEVCCARPDGTREGPAQEWHFTGSLGGAGEYRDGAREGLWTFWHPHGGKAREITYRSGRREGPTRSWHPDGTPEMEGQFLADERDGLWRTFHASGKLAEESRYRGGVRHALSRWFGKGGQPGAQFEFSNGVLAPCANPNEAKVEEPLSGRAVTICEKRSWVRGGPTVGWWLDGLPISVEHWQDGKHEPGDVSYDSYGAIHRETSLEGGSEVQRTYWPDGTLAEEVTSRSGRRQGPVKKWHANGRPLSEGTYRDGLLDGVWTSWREDGTPIERGTIRGDQRIGLWLTWDASGEPGEAMTYGSQGRRVFVMPCPEGARWVEEASKKIDRQYEQWCERGDQVRQGGWAQVECYGKVSGRGEYREGKREGRFRYFDPKGEVVREED